MAFHTRWENSRADDCQKQAEKQAGPSPFGYLYRFEDQSYSQSSGWGDDAYYTVVHIELIAIPIRRRTHCGWTIKINTGRGWRFVSDSSYKRYAHPTIKEAMESYIGRKTRQAAIYQAKVDRATDLADTVKRWLATYP